MKDGWDKAKTVSVIVSAILVPIVIGFIGQQYNASLAIAGHRLQYIEMSIDILSQEPSPNNKELRQWAIDIINEYSEIKLSPRVVEQLRDSVTLSRSDRTLEELRVQLREASLRGDQDEVRRLREILDRLSR